jgi:hypothetical protein
MLFPSQLKDICFNIYNKVSNMNREFHPLRLNQIKNSTLPMPLFLYEDEDEENITQAFYISDMSDFGHMLLPEFFVVTRETGNGVITTGTYQLVESVKEVVNDIDPLNN